MEIKDSLIDEFYAVLMGINIGTILLDSRFTEIDKGILIFLSWFYIVTIVIIYDVIFRKPTPKFRRTNKWVKRNPWIYIFLSFMLFMSFAIMIHFQISIILKSVQGYFLFFGGFLWIFTKVVLRRGYAYF